MHGLKEKNICKFLCYSTVFDLNEKYKTLTDLTVKPSGNYSGFSTKKNDAISGFIISYDKLDSHMKCSLIK